MREQWVRTAEAAEMLNVAQRTIQRHAKSGKLPSKQSDDGRNELLVLIDATESAQSSPKVTKSPKSRDSQKRKHDPKETQKTQVNATSSKVLQNSEVSCELAPVVTSPAQVATDRNIMQNNVVICGDNAVVTPNSQEDSQMAQVCANDNKLIVYNDLEDKAKFICRDTCCKLLSLHLNSVKNRIKSGIFQTVTKDMPHGGTKVFVLVSSLPALARGKYKESLIVRRQSQLVAYEDTFASATTQDKHIALATEDAIKLFIRYRKNAKKGGIRMADVEKAFIHDYNNGLILADRAGILGRLSIKTLYKKTKLWQASGEQLAVLCPRRKGNVGRRPVASDAFYAMLRVYALMGNARAKRVYRFVCNFIQEKDVDAKILSYTTAQRFIARIRREQSLIKARQEGATALAQANSYVARQNDALPGDVWQSDGYVLKILCTSPYNKTEIVRPLIVYYFDVATGFVTGSAISFSERADVVASAWHDALSRWPAPARCYS